MPMPITTRIAAASIALALGLAAQACHAGEAPPVDSPCPPSYSALLDSYERDAPALAADLEGGQARALLGAILSSRRVDLGSMDPDEAAMELRAAAIRSRDDLAEASASSAIASVSDGASRAAALRVAAYWRALAKIDSAPLAWNACTRPKP